jgi:integrase
VLFWRTHSLVQLDRDAVGDALKPLKAPHEAPEFLPPAECGKLLEASMRHDEATYTETRDEHVGAGRKRLGTTARYQAVAPFAAFLLLTGMRLSEAERLEWSAVNLDAVDADGRVVGEIRLRASATKTSHARTVGLDVCPSLRAMLAAMKLQAGTAHYVFGGHAPMSRALADAARKRLLGAFGAPEFSWQGLRSSCATYQCNAPNVFGSAAAFASAKRLGHSVAVSEKHYAGLFGGISREARTLEAAMQIEPHMKRVLAAVVARGVGGADVVALREAPALARALVAVERA